ncbi:Uncharacterised protein [Mycobacteroides abscessus subsp. abscessus]|nr:Uncharacterised protein [Mycobacteroides abscessus subsp. abscessus]
MQQADRTGDGAAGIDHVVGDDTGFAGHVADDAIGLDLIGHSRITGLVDEGQRHTTKGVGPLLGDAHAAGVGGYHHDVFTIAHVVLGDVAAQQ